jgi:hypothetical protein
MERKESPGVPNGRNDGDFSRGNGGGRTRHPETLDEAAHELSRGCAENLELLSRDSIKLTQRARLGILCVLLLASEGLYVALLRLDATNGLRPVLSFLGLLGGLFVLYVLAFALVRSFQDSSRAILLLIAAGAVLFRLTLLPAGLPHDASFRALLAGIRADLRGESVSFERFQLFDDDVWRYLWDGHVWALWAHGGNPYTLAPNDASLDSFAEVDNPDLTDNRAIWSDVRSNIPDSGVNTIARRSDSAFSV